MEWEGKTIYDFLNFAKDEAVKINVIRKEMENELERIKKIGKETEVEEKNKDNVAIQFVPELLNLMREYGVIKITPLNMKSYISQDEINGFNFYIGEE